MAQTLVPRGYEYRRPFVHLMCVCSGPGKLPHGKRARRHMNTLQRVSYVGTYILHVVNSRYTTAAQQLHILSESWARPHGEGLALPSIYLASPTLMFSGQQNDLQVAAMLSNLLYTTKSYFLRGLVCMHHYRARRVTENPTKRH